MKLTLLFIFYVLLLLFVAMLLFGCGDSPLSVERQTPDINKGQNFKIEINHITYEPDEILFEDSVLKINVGDLYWVQYNLNEIEYYRIY